jgi:predicted dehydrogenase
MYWIFGPPVDVRGRSVNQSEMYKAPDVSLLEAVFKNNICLTGMWAFNVSDSSTEDRCEIIGDQGKLRFSFFKKSLLEVITDRGTEILEPEYPVNIQEPMIDAVTKYFRNEGSNPCSLEDALVVMRMIDKTHL